MSNYSKGARGENELIELLEERGYVCVRAAGSGTAERESPDILVGKNGHAIAIEVKRFGKDQKYGYLDKDEVYDLQFFAESFGAEYYIAFRFDYGNWLFCKREEMKETKKSFRCERDLNDRTISTICQ